MRGGEAAAVTGDRSGGWDVVADAFMAVRSGVGTALVRAWALRRLPPGAAILDLGCGSGVPIAAALAEDGFTIWGVDPAPRMIAAFRHRLPGMPAACEPAQASDFFGRRFVGVIAVGVLFLLPPADQLALLGRVAGALAPGGHFLFSAPRAPAAWTDPLTGRASVSLGVDAYAARLADVGLRLLGSERDEGGNDYHAATRVA